MATYSSDREFVNVIRPILESGDFERLIRHVQREWPNSSLREMLFSGNDDAIKVALFCLSLTGKMQDCSNIACLLKHEDVFISRLAESALWSIWFRAGGESGNCELRRAVQLVGEERLEEACVLLDRLIERLPDFAEAYHQRAIVHFLLGNYTQARRDLLRVLRRNPIHFAAMAGLGHCCAAAGKLERSLGWYEQATRVYPRADGLQQAIAEINSLFCQQLSEEWSQPMTRRPLPPSN